MLCPVTQVEETKQMIKMLPILAATFIPCALIAQTHTLFVKQGTTLDRSVGPGFHIPPASLSAFTTVSMLISLVIYDRCFVPAISKYTKNPRGITLLQRIGVGLAIHVLIMIIAALREVKRLQSARDKGILEPKEEVPLTIFILLPQFSLMGVADAFVEVAKMEFLYDQAPEGMKSLGASYFTSSVGIGYFPSSFLLTTVKNITKRHGKEGWVRFRGVVCHVNVECSDLASIPDIINQLFHAVQQLYLLGARTFWIHNTGPLGCLPLSVIFCKGCDLQEIGCVKPQNDIALEFNRQLKDKVTYMRNLLPKAAFLYVDIYSAKHELISIAKENSKKKHGLPGAYMDPLK
ncbi:hypothetical protein ACLOJK_011293 [Asimina triloba]